MSHNQKIGNVGEALAVAHLKEMGMEILEQNWRKDRAEIDIIAQSGLTLRIIEVKSRLFGARDTMTASLNNKKLRSLVKGAELYLSTSNIKGVDEIFFDLVTVIFHDDGSHQIEYIPKFFYPSW